MVQLVLCGLLALALAGALFAVAVRFLPAGEQIAPPLRDEPPWELPPARRLASADVEEVRLPVALRGYRFAETDLLLDRLADELRARDEEIARLRALENEAPVDGGAAGHSSADPSPYNRPRPAEPVELVELVELVEPVPPVELVLPVPPVESDAARTTVAERPRLEQPEPPQAGVD